MNDRDRLRRSNMILVGIVLLFLLYGIVYRMQTGDNKLYIFGYSIDLPFGTEQQVTEQETTQEEAPSETK